MPEWTGSFDVAIAGGGVIGCAVAWRLAQAGMRVMVADRGEIGQEASAAAGGMLAPLAEADRADAFLELGLASRRLYPEFARELQAASGIDIEYRTEGTLYLAFNDQDEHELEERYKWQRGAGIDVQRLTSSEALQLEPCLNERLRWVLKFPDDHQVDNWKLVEALKMAATNEGVTFVSNTEVKEVRYNGGRACGLETARGRVDSNYVVVAAGCWSGSIQPSLPVTPVRGQMMAVTLPDGLRLNHVIYSRRGYLVPRHNQVVIAGSTTEHAGFEKSVTVAGLQKITGASVEILPRFTGAVVVDTWSGLRPKSADGWPILGFDPKVDRLLYATGHYRNGILLTPVTAQVISELILKGGSALDITSFRPDRFCDAARAA